MCHYRRSSAFQDANTWWNNASVKTQRGGEERRGCHPVTWTNYRLLGGWQGAISGPHSSLLHLFGSAVAPAGKTALVPIWPSADNMWLMLIPAASCCLMHSKWNLILLVCWFVVKMFYCVDFAKKKKKSNFWQIICTNQIMVSHSWGNKHHRQKYSHSVFK